MQRDPNDSPLDLVRLLDDAITETVSHEDADRFMAWFRGHVGDYETESSDGNLLDDPFIAVLGRSIWNALPLPGNGFKPRPLREPGRNETCFCGSGAKYKHCCAGRPMLDLDPEHILPSVIDHTPGEALTYSIRSGRVPMHALLQVAERRFQRGELWNTVDLLEPLFEGEIRRTDEHHGQALALLCDVYVELDHNRKKEELLQRIAQSTKRSPLRSDAWQRIAVTRLDKDDVDGAWEAFRHSQEDDPDAPGVGLLEVQILMSTGRSEEASKRAGFWVKRLRRRGFGDDDRLVEFFSEMTRDPHALMADMGVKAAGGAGGRLLEWLGNVADRPLPAYRVVELPDGASGEAGESMLHLVPPDAHRELQSRWREHFPLDKPFSVNEEPHQSDDPWDPDHEQKWMAFLEAHHEAFDSLDIIDDLATAMVRHPQYGAEWLDQSILEPLFTRAAAIREHALRDTSQPQLPWVIQENRPALRCLARRVYMYDRQGHPAAAAVAAERLLSLNPDDNHGVRNLVINHRLREGYDESALALALQYPGDLNPEGAYGRVLALYRLDRHDEAQAALCGAMEYLPKVVHNLAAERIKQPKLHSAHMTVGGDDQAWLYRESMRDVWMDTPGALEWLKQAAKRC